VVLQHLLVPQIESGTDNGRFLQLLDRLSHPVHDLMMTELRCFVTALRSLVFFFMPPAVAGYSGVSGVGVRN
jgi:hypothetical protein